MFTQLTEEWRNLKKPPVHFRKDYLYVEPKYFDAVSVNLPQLGLDKSLVVIATHPVWQEISALYDFPFPLYDYQAAAANALGTSKVSGLWFEVGGGKTMTALAMALWQRHADQGKIVVLMPPILVKQWENVSKSIGGVGGVLMYRGTPKFRESLDIMANKIILMSIQIFKQDFDKLFNLLVHTPVTVIVDEAISVKNPTTQNAKAVKSMLENDPSLMRKSKAKRTAKAARPESIEKQEAFRSKQQAREARARQLANDLIAEMEARDRMMGIKK